MKSQLDQSTNINDADALSQTQRLDLRVSVNDCHVQLPVSESKNSLFIELDCLELNSIEPQSGIPSR